nr:MAG TPA_asm: Kappa-conotoxin PVIIA knot, inhibitor, TOXIN [Caudoviricetes sp.]
MVAKSQSSAVKSSAVGFQHLDGCCFSFTM